MDSFSTFLYQSGISIAIFYLFYRMLLHRETWFTLNRILLGASMLLAVMIPFIRITLQSVPEPGTVYYAIDHLLVNGIIVRPDILAESTGIHITTGLALQYLYLLGVIFFSLKFLIQISQVLLLIRKHRITHFEGYRIVPITEEISPFSFFTLIFINRETLSDRELKSILLHEWEHVRRLHTLDILLLEVVCIIQWFNPFVWLCKYSLHELHEYEADQAVINQGENRLNYQKLILNQAFGHQFFQVAHNLINHSFIKKRIVMITKRKSKKFTLLKALLILPVAAVLVISFSFTREPENLNNIRQMFVKEQHPETIDHTSIIPIDTKGVKPLNDNHLPEVTPVGTSNPYVIQDTTIYFKPDTLPKFEGKDVTYFREWITNHIQYPAEAKAKKISGRVFIRFVVEKDGSVSNVGIIRGVDPLLDAEALRVVRSSPDWTPGFNQGKPVRVAFTFPITFVTGNDTSTGNTDKTGKGIKTKKIEEEIIPINRTTQRDKLPTSEVFYIVEEMPKFQGGDLLKFREWITDHLQYPEEAAKKGIAGKVFIRFIVEADGRVDQVKVIRGADSLLDAEALRVVRSSPDWTPGKQRGHTVAVAYTLPIVFLSGKEEVTNVTEKKGEGIADYMPQRQENTPNSETFFIVEQMPGFQGGDISKFREYVAEHLQYPISAVEKGMSGKVFVQWVVDKKGNVTNVKVVRGVDPALDAEAVRVVKSSPQWTPGRQRGKAVDVQMTTPIVFVLDNSHESKTGLFYGQPEGEKVYFIDGKKASEKEALNLDPNTIANVYSIKGKKAQEEAILITTKTE
jgi:TonB family protein